MRLKRVCAVARPCALGHDGTVVPISYRKANLPMKQVPQLTRDRAEALAIQALTFIAGDAERLGRFLAVTGIGPAEIRKAAGEPGFLAGVLEYMTSDDRLIGAFADETGINAADVDKARDTLAGTPWERELP